MITVAPFYPGDLAEFAVQPWQHADLLAHTPGTPEFWASSGPAFTARNAEGHILQCSGFVENHGRYASAWALLSADWSSAKVALHRATRRVIAETRYVRIDMSVRSGFAAAHEWARMLGFVREGTLRRAAPDGGDFDIYALVREDR
ncbi:hypothetical protein [Sphingomonas oligoaromativorans]|uniref:hypothetical protein n=1 Tax=Sphingomonas oligoaromativorans TaxID=575322 RepID=UPI001422381F|nr:hypothetical protein [Sphingomonas oligoaromativorans]NIJ34338.1 hypothetical protein [Sphingomonas oligoaromativorans]